MLYRPFSDTGVRGRTEVVIEALGGQRILVFVGIGEAGPGTVGVGQPAKQVIETADLLHDRDDVFDAGEFGAGQEGVERLQLGSGLRKRTGQRSSGNACGIVNAPSNGEDNESKGTQWPRK